MDSGLEELLQTFKEEAAEIFESVDMNLLLLEKDLKSADIINSIFRSVHTLKGSAGMMGMERTGRLAHALEDVLDRIRGKKISCTPDFITLFLKVVDCLKELVRDETSGKDSSDQYLDYIALLKEKMSEGSGAKKKTQQALTVDPEFIKQVEDSREKGMEVYQLKVSFDEMCMMKSSSAFLAVNGLGDLGEVLKVSPALDASELDEVEYFEVVFASVNKDLGEIAEVTDIPGMTLPAEINPLPIKKDHQEQEEEISEETEEEAEEESSNGSTSKNQEEKFYIRVPMNIVQEMMSMVDELFIGKSKFSNTVDEIKNSNPGHPIIKPMLGLSRNLDKLTSKIQKMVIDIRRIPLEREITKLNRQVRDCSMKYGKEVSFNIECNDVEVDREMWKKIVQALEIIIENCIDKSIEMPEERKAMGKESAAKINITADYLDQDIIMNIFDDGLGLGGETLDRVKIIQDTMSSVNGKFTIISNHGSGFKCCVRVPSNSSKVEVFFFRIGESIYAIPTYAIDRIVKVKKNEIKTVQGKRVMLHAGSVIWILDISIIHGMSLPESDQKESLLSIIINDNDMIAAIPVDEVLGEDEILIKKFENTIFESQYIIGATVLGDGTVIIVLNPGALISEGQSLSFVS